MTQERTVSCEVKEVDDKLRDLANNTSSSDLRQLARCMAQDHPTLVQRKMVLFLAFVDEVVKRWDDGDPRIASSVHLAQAIDALNPNLKQLPFI